MSAKKLISDRWEILAALVQGKGVLDIGCVNHEADSSSDAEWLHGKMCATAAKILGLDYAREEVDKLRAKGFNVRVGNAESFSMEERFDVVVAGNLIEHLSNPGNFLEACRKHINPGGCLALTTDNCYGLRSLKAIFLHDKILPNKEHVLAFEEAVLRQLLVRHGFRVREFYYYNGPYASAWKKKWMDALCRFRKSWAWQMLLIAEPVR